MNQSVKIINKYVVIFVKNETFSGILFYKAERGSPQSSQIILLMAKAIWWPVSLRSISLLTKYIKFAS